MGSCSEVCIENFNSISSIDSNNNNLELKDIRMSRNNLDSHVSMVVVGKNCTMAREIGHYLCRTMRVFIKFQL